MSRRSFWDRIKEAAARISGYAQDLKQELREEVDEAVREARQDVEQRKLGRDPATRRLTDELFERTQERRFAHHIGGHPSFSQYDVRKPGVHDDYDTVLLTLTSDDNIMWGDVGEAAFLIRQDDLDRRDFSRVMFTWDCH